MTLYSIYSFTHPTYYIPRGNARGDESIINEIFVYTLPRQCTSLLEFVTSASFEQEILDQLVELLLVFEVEVVLAVGESVQPGNIVRFRRIRSVKPT